MRVENAINSWQDWDVPLRSRPVILESLSGGRSNRSFLLNSDSGKLVLRVNGGDSLLPGAIRNNESQIWRTASELGIAPPMLYIDEQEGFLVSTYIKSSLPAQPPFGCGYSKRAFDLIKRCHQMELEAPAIDYASHIERYWGNIEAGNTLTNPARQEQRATMRLLLETLTGSGAETGLCHHDPVVANFVGNQDRLYLIDWEYAARGLLVMDYAAMAIEWEIDDDTIIAQTGVERDLLLMAKTLYKYICDLWEEQVDPGASPG